MASDLSRARDTAQAVAELLGLPLEIDAELRERAFGAFEGLAYDEIEGRYPQAWRQWQAREIDARYPAGEREAETLIELAHRVGRVLASIARQHAGQRVVAVTHGGFLDCAYRLATGMSLSAPRTFDVRNASINRFTWQDGLLRLVHWGDVEHLSPALDEIDR